MLKSIVGNNTRVFFAKNITSILKCLDPFSDGSIINDLLRCINEFQGIAYPYSLFPLGIGGNANPNDADCNFSSFLFAIWFIIYGLKFF